MCCDRARKNLDRQPNYTLAAYRPPTPDRLTRFKLRTRPALPVTVESVAQP